MFMPPTPASRNLRPTDGMASYRSTFSPAWLNTSAAINPAGPPPMMATVREVEGARSVMVSEVSIAVGWGILPERSFKVWRTSWAVTEASTAQGHRPMSFQTRCAL